MSSDLRRVRALAKAIVLAGIVAGITQASTDPDTALTNAEVKVNTTTAQVQRSAAVARRSDGDYVVVWTGATVADPGEIYLQRYLATGVAPPNQTPPAPSNNAETVVNATNTAAQTDPAVAMAADGRFVVAWTSASQDGSGNGVYARLYDAAGSAVAAEFKVNTTTANDQQNPAVAMAPNGDFVVVWQCLANASPATCDGSGQGIFGQRYSANGAKQGTEFQVNATSLASQQNPAVAMDAQGNFVVVWQSNGQDGDLNGIYARLYQADGTPGANEIPVNSITTGDQVAPSVGVAGDGSFVVAWQGPGTGTDVFARRFDSAGSPIDSQEFTVNTTTTGTQAAARVAVDASGDFVVAWESDQDASSYGVYARRYKADLSSQSNEVLVNSTPANDQRTPSVAMDADGDYVVAWDGNGSGDPDGVFMRRYSGPEAVDLKVAKMDSADPVGTSNSLTYTIRVTNQHAAANTTGVATINQAIGTATGVKVTDQVPTGETYVNAMGTNWTCANSSGTVICTYSGAFPVATSSDITLSVITAASSGSPITSHTLTNTATVVADQYDDDQTNNSATQETSICGATESPGTLAISNITVQEPNDGSTANAQVQVSRSGGSCGKVAVRYGTSDGTAKAGLDYTATSCASSGCELTWSDGDVASKTINVPILADALDENDETFTVALNTPTRATIGNGTATVTVQDAADDTPPTASVQATTSTVNEGDGTAKVKVVLNAVSGRDVSVNYTLSGTAANGGATSDYTVAASPLVIPAGQTSGDINFTLVDDTRDEGDETAIVTLGTGTTYAKAASPNDVHTMTIVDNDAAPVVQFTAAASSAAESTATRTLTVSLSPASGKTVTVPYTVSGSAESGTCNTGSDHNDYAITGGASPLVFSPGDTSKTITLTVCNDTIDETDETVAVTLTADAANPVTYQLGANATHTATITDDDNAPTVTFGAASQPVAENVAGGTATVSVTLSSSSAKTVTVPYTISGTALGSGPNADYAITGGASPIVFNPGDPLTKSITVSVVNDSLDENDETAIFTLGTLTNASPGANPTDTLTITDDDATPHVSFTTGSQSVAENGGTAKATLSLSAVSGRDVTVPYTVSGSATGSGTDYTLTPASPVTIPAGTQSVDLTFAIVDDVNAESDETATVTIGTPTTGTPSTNLTVDNNGTTSFAAHTLTINDNDAVPQAYIDTANSASTVAEGGNLVMVTIKLSRPADQDVTVKYSFSGTATNGTDYTANPASQLIIPQGQSSGTVSISATNDNLAEGTETIAMQLTSAVNATLQNPKTQNLTLTDNDTAGVTVTESGGSTNVIEGGATDSYTVVLASQPTADVTITVTGTAQATVDKPSLTFTNANWNVPQTVTVTAVDDNIAEGTHATSISQTASSADGTYNGTPVASVNVNITDNDSAGVAVVEIGGSTAVTEGGATDSYTLALTSQPTNDVTFSVTPDAQVTVDKPSVTFTNANWNVPQTIKVTAVDDAYAEGAHTGQIVHGTPSSIDTNYNSSAAKARNITVQITDNDTVGVVLSKASVTVAEGGATDAYNVHLNSQPAADVTVTLDGGSQLLESSGGSAPAQQLVLTFTQMSGVPGGWNVDQVVTVGATDDNVVEGAHSGMVTHTAGSIGDSAYNFMAGNVTASITDNDTTSLSVANASVTEGTGAGTTTLDFVVTLVKPSAATVTVDYASVDGTATAPADYAATSGTLTFAPGEVSKTVSVTVVRDAMNEVNETMTLHLSNPSGAPIATADGTGTITDDDAVPSVSFSASSQSVTEGNSGNTPVTVTATLNAVSGQSVTVPFTVSGTATNPSDDDALSGNIVIPAGSLSAAYTFNVVGDTAHESDETVIFTMGTPVNATQGGTTSETVTIVDDDPAPSDGGGGGSFGLLSLWMLVPAALRRRRKLY